MGPDVAVSHLPIILRPDPARVVLRPFIPADDPAITDGPSRAQRLTERVMALNDQVVAAELARVVASLIDRSRTRLHDGGKRTCSFLADRRAIERAIVPAGDV